MKIVDAYPLSKMQSGMYYHYATGGTDAVYHDVFSLRIEAPLSAAPLQAAIERLLAAHPVLRTSFDFERFSQPMQLVHQRGVVRFVELDATALAGKAVEEFVTQRIQLLEQQPFDLQECSLIRFTVIRRTDREFQLLVDAHHMILDGWSMAMLITELFRQYLALLGLVQDQAIPRAPATSFKEFIKEELEQVSDPRAVEFWRAYLADHYYRPFSFGTRQGAGRHARLRASLSRYCHRLMQFAREEQAALRDLLMAVHMRMCAALQGSDAPVSNVIVNGRLEVPGGEAVAGLFVNTLPLRLQLQDQSWRELIAAVKHEQQRAVRFRRFPYSEIVRLHGSAISDLCFNYVHFHVYKSLQGLNGFNVVAGTISERDNIPLSITFHRGMAEDLEIIVQYDTARLGEADAQRLIAYFDNAIECMLSEPDARHHQQALAILGGQERQRLLVEWNDTEQPELLSHGWLELFDQQVALRPDAVVAVCGDSTLTYHELSAASARIAQALAQRPMQRESIVALLHHRGLDLLVQVLGVLRAGAAYLLLDPAAPSQHWLDVLTEAQPDLLLVGSRLDKERSWLAERWLTERVSSPAQLQDLAGDASARTQYPAPSDLAYVCVSGSTGCPKGVMIEHRGLINNIRSKCWTLGLTDADVIAQTAFQCFDTSVWQLLIAPVLGAKVVILPDEATRDVRTLLQHLSYHAVTVWEAAPAVLQAALDCKMELPSIRWVLSSGEPLPASLVSRWFDQYPAVPLLNAYGSAECAGAVAYQPMCCATQRVLIGSAAPNARLHVVDARLGLLPVGVVGELAVSGPVVARGYLNAAELTRSVFLDNPYRQGLEDDRLYRTGDLVRRLADGALEYVGRADFQVKIRGFRIEPGEIEAALRRQKGVAEAVVVVREDDRREKRVVAYYRSETGDLGRQLRSALSTELPEYMVPALLVQLHEFPRMASGKIDRSALPAPAAEVLRTVYAAPRTPTEKSLCNIWCRVLGVECIGIDDDFFKLGGHSLLVTRVLTEIHSEFRVRLSFVEFFEQKTIAGVARILTGRAQQAMPSISARGAVQAVGTQGREEIEL